MHHRYFAKGSELNTEQSSGKQAPNNRETKYRVSNAGKMNTEELIEAIRNKIQETLLMSSGNSGPGSR